ncbi:YceI family protein [Sediminitomix flava]|uniref:Polyisoprenoid-binding protein YceI n=1 Tax=Sediminitomix flava TaxID=379075 RepID=A0A315ZIQ9_SEDFL|nr:YceI family protein [Sediminitomix flava]PWJ45089.1 polyisoprenoid-binding protein YceI [Sediminitomix flava]
MKKLTVLLLALATVFFAFKPANEKGTYAVKSAESTVKWIGKKVSGEHFGMISVKEGSLDVKKGQIKGGTFVIDMNTITVDDIQGEWADKLLGHLKSDDFFSVEKFNTATLEITNVKGKGSEVEVEGNLTIKGITKPIAFPAKVSIEGNTLTAEAKISVDRTQYDIKYGSGSFFDGLGDKMIYDNFDLEVALTAAL